MPDDVWDCSFVTAKFNDIFNVEMQWLDEPQAFFAHSKLLQAELNVSPTDSISCNADHALMHV